MKPYLLLVAIIMALCTATTVFAKTKVGLLLPYSGTYAVLGNEITDGFTFAIEEAGKTNAFAVLREDTEVKPNIGLSKARKLVFEDGVDVIAGIVSSAVLGAVRDFIASTKVPLIVANAGNDKATGESCSPYIVRVSFSNSQINRPMGTWLGKKGVKKVYTLAPDYAAGHQMINAFTQSFEAAGGKVVGGEFTPFGKTSDFAPYLANAKSSGATAMYAFYAGGEAIKFVKQYGSFGKELPLYGAGFVTSPLYVEAEGEGAVGIVGSLHYVPTLKTTGNREFVQAFKAQYNRQPSEYAVQGYDAARLLIAAVDSGASDSEAIASALASIRQTSPRGPIEIDPATNNVIQNIYVLETIREGGKLTQKVIATIPMVRDLINGCKL